MADGLIHDPDGAVAALAARVVRENGEHGRTIALAESCTGGLVAAALTDVPGSSAVLLASLVTYSNNAKTSMLGVSHEIIETFGAVSTATAWAMAQGALRATGADVAVAVSGIAGPGGGTEAKPVGTVSFARVRAGAGDAAAFTVTERFDPDAGRDGIRRQALLAALELLLPEADSRTGHG